MSLEATLADCGQGIFRTSALLSDVIRAKLAITAKSTMHALVIPLTLEANRLQRPVAWMDGVYTNHLR